MAQKSSTAKKASKGSTSKSKSKRKSAPKTKTVKAIKPTLALAESSTPVSSPKPSALRRFLDWPFFAHVYAGISLAVLLSTSSYWALLGARINAGNADQLANTYLFEHVTTFTAALMPDQHSFLLKWPIFLLIRLFGTTSSAFMVATVAMVLVTIAGLAYLLYRIERRALLFGTLCLALASMLLLIPAQPYPGGMLPMNMAMVTTRNLEYLVFIGGILLAARVGRLWSWRFLTASLAFALLMASDKLFVSLSLGGALAGLVLYSLARRWRTVKVMAWWLATGVLGAALAMGVLLLLDTTGATHIAKDAAIAGPYGLVYSAKDLALGSVYAVLGLLTNFGANPAADTRLLAIWPHHVVSSMATVHSVGFVSNLLLTLAGAGAAVYVLIRSIWPGKLPQTEKSELAPKPEPAASLASDLAVMLILASVVAVAAFVGSRHYYPVDARYMSIAFFASVVCLANLTRKYRAFRPELVVAVGVLLMTGIGLGIGTATATHKAEQSAMADTNKRNSLIAEALKRHPVSLLVGDYWRVLPVKLALGSKQTVVPQADCTQNRDLLSSKAWQQDLSRHSFAYVLTLDKSLTGYKPCSLQQVTARYGLPNASVLVAGNHMQPKELLLFYDEGSNKSAPKVSHTPATVTPVGIDYLQRISCSGPTILNIVAHQDDDLLFMSPDLLYDIKADHCVRTVYVTSGDAGTGKYYWLSRERGSETAYATMLGGGSNTIWIQRIVRLPGGQFITIANPQGNSKISLVFMHLPDGNLVGQGFKSSDYESLAHLEKGIIPVLHSADMQSAYSPEAFTAGLTALMQGYRPQEIRTQASVLDRHYPDHSDHMAVGRYTKAAYARYAQAPNYAENPASLSFYVGYPIHSRPSNVSGPDLEQKDQAFFEYAHFDGGACTSEPRCQGTAYDAYLKRQYKSEQ